MYGQVSFSHLYPYVEVEFYKLSRLRVLAYPYPTKR